MYFDSTAAEELAYPAPMDWRCPTGTVDAPVTIWFCGEWMEDNGQW